MWIEVQKCAPSAFEACVIGVSTNPLFLFFSVFFFLSLSDCLVTNAVRLERHGSASHGTFREQGPADQILICRG